MEPMETLAGRARAPLAAALLGIMAGCAPGTDGAFTVVDHGLLPAELRVVHATEDGGFWAAGHHEGSLAGSLLRGADGSISALPGPQGLLWDYAHVDLDEPEPGVLWLTATSHVFRVEGTTWEIFRVPDDAIDGVVAGTFPADRAGWIAAQSWDGPRIWRFDGDGFAAEEAIDADLAAVSLAVLTVQDDGRGYAAGLRRADADEAVLLRREGERWTEVALPGAAAEIGPIRDLDWGDDGATLWVVADRLLRGSGDAFEEQPLPDVGAQFIPRVGAFHGHDEGWLAGFGVEALFHRRGGIWEAVPAERLVPGAAEAVAAGDLERTWLFDDAHFDSPRSGWFVATFVDCDAAGACTPGEALLHYDRDDSTRRWEVEGGWQEPADVDQPAPALIPTAVARAPDGTLWISGDADPDGPLAWNAPQTWRQAPGEPWVEVELPERAVLHEIRFADDGGAWAVGAVREGEETGHGVILHYEGGVWRQEPTDEVLSVDWDLRGVAWGPDGTVYAVGRRAHLPLALARVDGAWEIVKFDEYAGATAMWDVTVNDAGVVWAVGTSWLGSGAIAGYLATGDVEGGLEVRDLDGWGRECGPSGERYACWSLRGVDAGPDGVVAVGEATVLRFGLDGIDRTETNMSLLAVSHDGPGLPWVLAENGWWDPALDSWSVHRHWDRSADDGVVRSLQVAAPDFALVAGHREALAGGQPELVGSFVLSP